MLVAKIVDGAIADLQDYRAMFPDTSFPASGPNSDFYTENSLMPVSYMKSYDPETEEIVPCAPYIENGTVYTVQVQAKPEVSNAN